MVVSSTGFASLIRSVPTVPRLVALTLALGIGVVACAGDDVPISSSENNGKVDAGRTSLLDSAAPFEGDDAGDENDGDGDDGGSFGGDDAGLLGSDSGARDGAAGGDGGLGGACTAPNTCMGARDIGTVSGDKTPSGTLNSVTVTGTTSEWLKILVTEDSSSPLGQKLGMKVSLASPPGSNYDLETFIDKKAKPEARACTLGGTVTSSTSMNPVGQIDSITETWGEGATSNASDDALTVTIHIIAVSGTCAANGQWTLTVKGNP